MELDERGRELIERGARMAAQAHAEEGTHRVAQNMLALISWAGQTRVKHRDCGQLDPVLNDEGYMEAVDCPVHGRLDAPEWVSVEDYQSS